MRRPQLLDLFCCAGGAAAGYASAGFDVVGIDIEPQPHYPFRFLEYDAVAVLKGLVSDGEFSGLSLAGFDAIHASPPCQDYSRAMSHFTSGYPRLIEPVRRLLAATGLPWVIENVPGAPLPDQPDLFGSGGLELCGTMFGLLSGALELRRHRLFETSFAVSAPRGCSHTRPAFNPHNQRGRDRIYAAFGDGDPEIRWRALMGVPWMSREEGREAVPPAYTEFVGRRLLEHIRERAA